jgi:hypothetical protein
MRTNVLSQSTIQEWWFYSDGNLYWSKTFGSKIKAGVLAGSPKSDGSGYVRITFKRKQYMLQNLVWIMHYGEIPQDLYVDHIDNDPSNNHVQNLQLLTITENLVKRSYVKYPSGTVYQRSNSSKWCAKINYKGQAIHIGTYLNKQDATDGLAAWRIKHIV